MRTHTFPYLDNLFGGANTNTTAIYRGTSPKRNTHPPRITIGLEA